MPRRVPYEPVRVSEAVRFRLAKQGAFQPAAGGQPTYPIYKDVAALVGQTQVLQTHTLVNELGVLMGPMFMADSLDRAALVVWGAIQARCPVFVASDLSGLFVTPRRPLQAVIMGGGGAVRVVRGSSMDEKWEVVGPTVESGTLSMTVNAPQEKAAEVEGVSAWLMFRRSDRSEVPLAPGTVKDGRVEFQVDLRTLGVELDRAILKDPDAVERKFWVRLV